MPTRPHALLSASLLLLLGCSAENAYQLSGDGSLPPSDEADDDTGDEATVDLSLRLDISPSDADLVAQSFTLGDDWRGLDLTLNETVLYQGRITGYEATPPSAILVPGEEVPVVGLVKLTQPDGVATDATLNDAEGNFDLAVPAGEDYRLSVVPRAPSALPFLVEEGLSLTGDLDEADEVLDYGVPVYGVVSLSDGTPVPRAEVSLLDSVGVQGTSTTTDETGYYQLRAFPGTYELLVEGESTRAIPSTREVVEVDDTTGARVDVGLGDNVTANFGCIVVDASGRPLGDVTVLLRSQSLKDADLYLERETSPDQDGVLFVKLLPGVWTVDFIPPYSAALSPVTMTVQVEEAGLELSSSVILPELVPVTMQVVGPGATPLAGAIVSAKVVGFDETVYSGQADADGIVRLDLPDVSLSFTITPPDDSLAITRLTANPTDADLSVLSLDTGEPVSGRVMRPDGESGAAWTLIELVDAATGTSLGTTLTDEEGRFSVQIQP